MRIGVPSKPGVYGPAAAGPEIGPARRARSDLVMVETEAAVHTGAARGERASVGAPAARHAGRPHQSSRRQRKAELMVIRSMWPRMRSTLIGLALLATVGSGCTAVSDARLGGSVSVVGSWSGAEEEAFLAMVAPFEESTGVVVNYTSTRDLDGLLWEAVAKGRPPDVAGLPGPGQMVEFARHGALRDLSEVVDVQAYKAGTVPAFTELGTVDGELVGVFIKATLKGLIWFNPRIYTLEPPTTWQELEARAALAGRGDTSTWCLALESEATSG